MYLKNKQCVIRSVKKTDARVSFSELEYSELQNLTETHLYQSEMPAELIFTVENEGKQAGEISLKSIRWFNRKAEIAIFISEPFRGRGLAQETLKMVIEYAFYTMNFYRLEAEVVDYNPAAKALFEKLGFVQEGVLREAKYFHGKYHDIYRYGLLAKEWGNIS